MSIQSEVDRLKQNISAAFNAVSSKGGTVPSSKVSGNLVSAISSIPVGAKKREKSGTFTTNSSGTATVNCGFVPDYVVISNPRQEVEGLDQYVIVASAVFAYNPKNLSKFVVFCPVHSSKIQNNSFDITRTSSGFSLLAENVSWSGAYSTAKSESFNYYAAKYE